MCCIRRQRSAMGCLGCHGHGLLKCRCSGTHRALRHGRHHPSRWTGSAAHHPLRHRHSFPSDHSEPLPLGAAAAARQNGAASFRRACRCSRRACACFGCNKDAPAWRSGCEGADTRERAATGAGDCAQHAGLAGALASTPGCCKVRMDAVGLSCLCNPKPRSCQGNLGLQNACRQRRSRSREGVHAILTT